MRRRVVPNHEPLLLHFCLEGGNLPLIPRILLVPNHVLELGILPLFIIFLSLADFGCPFDKDTESFFGTFQLLCILLHLIQSAMSHFLEEGSSKLSVTRSKDNICCESLCLSINICQILLRQAG